jgi:hypothetical protein
LRRLERTLWISANDGGEASVYNYADRLLIDLDANCDRILDAATAACDDCRGRHRCQYHEGFADGLGAAVIARVSLPPTKGVR